MDNNKDYMTFGGTNMTKDLLGLVTSGEFDTKPIDTSEIKEDYAFRFSKPITEGSKGISILDFDDTLATTKSSVRFTKPDGTKGKSFVSKQGVPCLVYWDLDNDDWRMATGETRLRT